MIELTIIATTQGCLDTSAVVFPIVISLLCIVALRDIDRRSIRRKP